MKMAAGARFVFPPDAGELLTAETLRRHLESERRPAAFGDTQFAPRQQDMLRRTFSEQSRRSLELFGDPRLKLPETSGLFRRAEDVLAMMRLLHREIQWFGTPQAVLVDPGLISEGLRSLHSNLDCIASQLKLIHQIDALSGKFHQLLEDLQQLPTTPADQLWDLVHQIARDGHQVSNLPPVVSITDFSVSQYLQRTCKPAQSQVMASGIETASLISWLTRQIPEWLAMRETLIAASLLVDCGFVTLCSWSRITPAELRSDQNTAYRQHPAVGAALAAGIKGLPIEIPLMIARHHERLDGSGFPAGLNSSELASTARLLAIVARLVELMYGVELAHQDDENMPREEAGVVAASKESGGFATALACLQAEAEQGAWDQKLTARVLQMMGYRKLEVEDTAANDGIEEAPGAVPAAFGRLSDRFRRDEAHDTRPTGGAPRIRSRSGNRRSAMIAEQVGNEIHAGIAPLAERGTDARSDASAPRGTSEK